MTQILACVDGSAVSESVCDHAAWAYGLLQTSVSLLHVLERPTRPVHSNLSGSIGLGSREGLLQELAASDERLGRVAILHGKTVLHDAEQRLTAQGVPRPSTLLRHGRVLETVIELEPETGLLIIGKHPERMGAHVGSRLESIVRTIHRPILIAPETFSTPRRTLLAFDGSDTSRAIIERATRSPLIRTGSLTVLMAGENSANKQMALSWAEETLTSSGIACTIATPAGKVEDCIANATAEHDLIVMGAYGHSTVRRFLVGSTTTHVIQHASVPVLVLR